MRTQQARLALTAVLVIRLVLSTTTHTTRAMENSRIATCARAPRLRVATCSPRRQSTRSRCFRPLPTTSRRLPVHRDSIRLVHICCACELLSFRTSQSPSFGAMDIFKVSMTNRLATSDPATSARTRTDARAPTNKERIKRLRIQNCLPLAVVSTRKRIRTTRRHSRQLAQRRAQSPPLKHRLLLRCSTQNLKLACRSQSPR